MWKGIDTLLGEREYESPMTKFKVADHKTIRANERDFLFLAAEKTIFEMDPPTRDLLGRWSEAGEATLEEVRPG